MNQYPAPMVESKITTIRLQPALLARVRALAELQNRTLSNMIATIVAEHLDRLETAGKGTAPKAPTKKPRK